MGKGRYGTGVEQAVIKTNPKVEEQKEFQEKIQGMSADEEQTVWVHFLIY